uniref:Vesicle transport through interaction with t-SNAREs homolog 1B-like n=1 Tax=Sinocyclocheilus rhinocerous TaxID=307959 RepID=A0A673LIZ8_9TELE
MSTEEFEKLHEMYRSLYEEVKLMPERAQRCQGEERKRIVRDFDECVSEAEEVTHLQSQRALLIQGTESLNNASKSIERSQRIAAETDQIGTDIIEELGEQREQLDRTRDRVRERYLDQRPLLLLLNKQIINCTSKILVTNKLLLSVIIIMELAILAGVVYLKFFRK